MLQLAPAGGTVSVSIRMPQRRQRGAGCPDTPPSGAILGQDMDSVARAAVPLQTVAAAGIVAGSFVTAPHCAAG